MASVYLLIPLSILLIGIGVWAFFWAVDRGQFEDLERASELALEEDDMPTAAANAARVPRS